MASTTTKDSTGCRKTTTSGNQGIRTIDRPGRPHPFGVQWREFDKDKNQMGRKPEFFEKEAERDKKVRDLAAMKREVYTATMTREEIASWTAFQSGITGYTWQEVVANQHAFIAAASNKKAPGIKLASNGPYAVMVSDIDMPGMNGIELLSRVTAAFPTIVQVVLTGKTDFETFTEAISQGNVFRYIAKSFDGAALRDVLSESLERYKTLYGDPGALS